MTPVPISGRTGATPAIMKTRTMLFGSTTAAPDAKPSEQEVDGDWLDRSGGFMHVGVKSVMVKATKRTALLRAKGKSDGLCHRYYFVTSAGTKQYFTSLGCAAPH